MVQQLFPRTKDVRVLWDPRNACDLFLENSRRGGGRPA